MIIRFCVKNPPAVKNSQETRVQSLNQEDLLEKQMASLSSILAWRIPRAEKPGGLHPWGAKSGTQLSVHWKPKIPFCMPIDLCS